MMQNPEPNADELREKIASIEISSEIVAMNSDGSVVARVMPLPPQAVDQIMREVQARDRTRTLAVLEEVEREVVGGKVGLNDIYGNDPRNNYGYNETQVRDAANWLKDKQRTAIARLKDKYGASDV